MVVCLTLPFRSTTTTTIAIKAAKRKNNRTHATNRRHRLPTCICYLQIEQKHPFIYPYLLMIAIKNAFTISVQILYFANFIKQTCTYYLQTKQRPWNNTKLLKNTHLMTMPVCKIEYCMSRIYLSELCSVQLLYVAICSRRPRVNVFTLYFIVLFNCTFPCVFF